MLIVIAGGIGSGKSTVAKILEGYGYTVIRADDVNRELLGKREYTDKLRKLFPEAFEGDVLDKRKLRKIIFGSEEKRATLNALAHPAILGEIKDRAVGKALVFAEIPLAGETLDKEYYDKLCVVTASEGVRASRVATRDNVTAEEAYSAIRAQKAENDLAERADYVIYNDCDLITLEERVKTMLDDVR